MKNILFISPTGTLDNGAEFSIITLMEYLVAKKHYNVFNVFPDYQNLSQQQYFEKMKELKITAVPIKTSEWWWMDSPVKSGLEDYTRVTFHRDNLFRIRQIIRDNEIDLVITNTANIFYGAIASACEEIGHYWLIHELPFGEFEYYEEKLPFIVDNSDEVFAVTGSLSKILNSKIAKFSSKKVHSFIPFSKLARTSKSSINDEVRFISVGMINENKNQLEILKSYKNSGLSNQLIFIGGWDEEYKRICDEFIEKNNLSSVKFLGYKENPWEFASDNDIAVFSSKSESFGLVYVEAILNSIPTIASNNLGFQIVNQIFKAGRLYVLGDERSLASAMKDTLINFDKIKFNLNNQISELKMEYTVESCFLEIIDKIDNFQLASKKSISSVKHLLGMFSEDKNLLKEMKEMVRIFFCTNNKDFTIENSFSIHLKNKDSVDFEVPHNATHLRIDLGELPSIFQKVILKSELYQTEILPSDTNGFFNERGFIFTKDDPQLIYDISCFDKKFTLLYEKVNILENSGANFFEKIATDLTNLEREYNLLSQNYNRMTLSNEKLNLEYTELHSKYHAVIGSRRWTFPTKIINFFRRKK